MMTGLKLLIAFFFIISFLNHRHIFHAYLNAEIASTVLHHNAVHQFNDFINIFQPFHIFNFGIILAFDLAFV